VAAPVRGADGTPEGAVVVSTFLPAQVAQAVREVRDGYTKFRETQTYREPILAFYRSLYLFPALLILFGAVWLALYLARRITTPLRLVAEGAERIAAGERGVRVDFPSGSEEFRALIASFNRMSEKLARSEEEVEFSRGGLVRKNQELEERRRLTETVLETVGTGVVVVDQEATVTAVNAAAQRLLELDAGTVGLPLEQVLRGPGREEIHALVLRLLSGRVSRQEREVIVPSRERDRHLALTVVSLPGSLGSAPGALVVVDDLTPLMRAQKVAAWGEVARKLAHEIKNPLTPIQLSAQRVRKAWLKSDPGFEKILTECTRAIVDEVEALKNLVDEFAQFARLPAASLQLASLHDVIDQALSLYDGLFPGVAFERRLAPDLPALRLDPDQMKRALINLVDNAVEATEGKGRILVSTEYDRAEGRARLVVADDGPGIAPADRDRLFVPHFSTKKRGSGLGLAIVNRIVQEHLGTIRAEDNAPRGARFVVELPA
jgi:two-component system nitrogen regulation sensor histidine kinase NtrY